jgi:hypothetical protein
VHRHRRAKIAQNTGYSRRFEPGGDEEAERGGLEELRVKVRMKNSPQMMRGTLNGSVRSKFCAKLDTLSAMSIVLQYLAGSSGATTGRTSG